MSHLIRKTDKRYELSTQRLDSVVSHLHTERRESCIQTHTTQKQDPIPRHESTTRRGMSHLQEEHGHSIV